jgi:hypothetical protein
MPLLAPQAGHLQPAVVAQNDQAANAPLAARDGLTKVEVPAKMMALPANNDHE